MRLDTEGRWEARWAPKQRLAEQNFTRSSNELASIADFCASDDGASWLSCAFH